MRQKRNEEAEARAFTGVSVGKARQGRGDSLGLASLNNSAKLRGIGADPSCPVRGPGLTSGRAELAW